MIYKASAYNHITRLEGGQNILYNFLTGGLAEMKEEDVQQVTQILDKPNLQWDGHAEQLKSYLITQSYLIPEQANELNLIRFRNLSTRFNSLNYKLTVMPTLDCNFACKYCYETRQTGFFSNDVRQGILKWIEKNLPHMKNFHLAWYGGEPLLDFSIIEEVNTHAKNLSLQCSSSFSSSMATNGYLLTDSIISRLNDLNITGLQITLDGTESYHDKFRPLRNGNGSFHVVFNNILKVLESTEIKVLLRVNLDKNNYENIPQLIDSIPEKYRTPNLIIYFRPIFTSPNKNAPNNPEITENRLFDFKVIQDIYRYAIKSGYTVSYPLTLNEHYYCEACLKNNLVVNPSGELFSCPTSDELGWKIGNITKDGELNIDPFEYSKWFSHIPGDDPMCAECKFLPICLGGCIFRRLRGKNTCPHESINPDELVEILYLTNTQHKSK